MNTRDQMKQAMDNRPTREDFPTQGAVYGDPAFAQLRKRIAADKALERKGEKHFAYMDVELDPLGLEIPTNMQPDQFRTLTTILFELEDQTQLWIGDLLVVAESNQDYVDIIRELMVEYNREEDTIYKYHLICKGVPKFRRRNGLTISHYERVYWMKDEIKQKWIDRAARGNGAGKPWTVMELAEAIKRARGDRPTPPAMKRFMQSFKQARETYLDLANELKQDKEGRRQMANALRGLADQIERLG